MVALRKESVDRNTYAGYARGEGSLVALRKESVDRNTHTTTTTAAVLPSLSARRAWIEMRSLCRMLFAMLGRSPQGERG